MKDFRLQLVTALLKHADSLRDARLAAQGVLQPDSAGEEPQAVAVAGQPGSMSTSDDDLSGEEGDNDDDDDDDAPAAGAGAGAGALDPLRPREFVPHGSPIAEDARILLRHELDFLPSSRKNFHRCYVCQGTRPRMFCLTCKVYLCAKPYTNCHSVVHAQ